MLSHKPFTIQLSGLSKNKFMLALFSWLHRRLKRSDVRALDVPVYTRLSHGSGEWDFIGDIPNGSAVTVEGGLISLDGVFWYGGGKTDWMLGYRKSQSL